MRPTSLVYNLTLHALTGNSYLKTAEYEANKIIFFYCFFSKYYLLNITSNYFI